MNQTRDEGEEAFADLAVGLLFVGAYALHDYAVNRGLTAVEALQDLALKVAEGE